MGDAPDQMFVLAVKDIVDQHVLHVSYSSNVFQCQDIQSGSIKKYISYKNVNLTVLKLSLF